MKLKIPLLVTVALFAGVALGQQVFAQPADAIYHGGSILTMAGDKPAYVEAIAVRDGKIVFTGSADKALKMKSEATKVVDLKGKALLPGFIDAHGHYINSLLVANQAKLYPPPSGPGKDVPGIIAELKKFAKDRNIPKGEMIMGYGYDDSVMPDGRLLNRDDLDAAFPDNPVRVDHVSMHGAVMNSLALKKYGISAQTKTPPGGVIVRVDPGGSDALRRGRHHHGPRRGDASAPISDDEAGQRGRGEHHRCRRLSLHHGCGQSARGTAAHRMGQV